jgi:hypothetical protein
VGSSRFEVDRIKRLRQSISISEKQIRNKENLIKICLKYYFALHLFKENLFIVLINQGNNLNLNLLTLVLYLILIVRNTF